MWLQTKFQFTNHRACLYVRLWSMNNKISDFIEKTCNKNVMDPDKVEAFIQEMIEYHRPELKGCKIFGMDYSGLYARYEFHVEHPSLPICKLGKEAVRMPLVPGESDDCT